MNASKQKRWCRRKRLLRRALLRLRFRLIDERRLHRPVLEHIGSQTILVLPGVFPPGLFYSGAFLARHLNATRIPKGSTVLDLGTGSGVASVFAARWARSVIAADINPDALRCARINALLNQVEGRVEVIRSNLFERLNGRNFNVVLFNPPFLKGEPTSSFEQAFRSGDVAPRFARTLGRHLRPKGRCLLVLSTQGSGAEFLSALKSNGFQCQLSDEESHFQERFLLYTLSASQ